MSYEDWQNALVAVYTRSLRDPVFRQLCVTDPAEALLQAAGYALAPGVVVQFLDTGALKTYAYVLPPVLPANATREGEEAALIQWSTACTDFPDGPPS